jgi:broad specificity phosphatase PhoE
MIDRSDRLLQLYFVRHGGTEWSLSGQHTGRTDIPLTPSGEAEARALRPLLEAVSFSHVLTSPLVRARRTCELVGLAEQSEIEPDLSEWDYGAYEGRRTVDIQKECADWSIFRDGCRDGETPAEISDRADRLLARLRRLQGKVALFSHGHFGCVLAARWIGIPVVNGQHFALGTASLSILGHELRHPTTPVIALWNATPAIVTGFGSD